MKKKCISCNEATDNETVGQIGAKVGPLCPDCEFWCDGNIISTAEATA